MLTSYEVFKYIILNMFRVMCNKESVSVMKSFSTFYSAGDPGYFS